ncbi:MAG: hypothetical protein WC343_14520 [Bacilli bacterium]|jgi:hypothetical protein
MAKLVADAVLDAALQYLEDNVDFLSVCEGAPTTYEHAHSNKGTGAGKVLASSATPTFTGPADDTSGRKTTVDEEAAMTVDVSGAADHVALCDVGSTALLYVTTATEQSLTSGNTVTVPAWKIGIGDPT